MTDNKTNVGRIGTDEIELQLEATRAFLRALAHRCETLAARCPRNCFVGSRIDPRVEAIWALRVAGRTRGWDGLGDKLPNVARMHAWVEAPGGKASKERSALTARLEERVALLERWQTASVAEGDELAEAMRQLERGHPRAARTLQDRASAERFSHPLWMTLAERESAFLESIEQVRQAPNSKKALMLARLVRAEADWAKVESDSEYGVELATLERGALRRRRNSRWAIGVGLVVLLVAIIVSKRATDENERLQAIAAANIKVAAEAKAEAERVAAEAKAEAERVAAEAKAEAERVAAEAERLRAENELIAAKAKAEAERIAAAAKAEAERLRAEEEAEAERSAAAAKAETERIAHSKSLVSALSRAGIPKDKIQNLLKKGGLVFDWGRSYDGRHRNSEDRRGVVAIAAGDGHILALKKDGTVVAWGPAARYSSKQIPSGLNGVVAIATEEDYVCLALKSDGTVVEWGESREYGSIKFPTQGLSGVVAISAGSHHSLALMNDGTVFAWGSNDEGQCRVPQGLSGVVAIAAGDEHSLALKSDGTVVAWGDNRWGTLNIPQKLSGVVAIAAGANSLALKSDGTIVAWGSNSDGVSKIPRGLSGVVAIAVKSSLCLALKKDGTVVAWGFNGEGQTNVPQGLSGVVAIAAGGRLSSALIIEPDN